MSLDRERIDKVRKLLLDAFMAEDMTTYSQCVIELERLIGVPHGDRNPKGAATPARIAQKRAAAISRQFRWGDRKLDAELHEDGALTYSISYGKGGEE